MVNHPNELKPRIRCSHTSVNGAATLRVTTSHVHPTKKAAELMVKYCSTASRLSPLVRAYEALERERFKLERVHRRLLLH